MIIMIVVIVIHLLSPLTASSAHIQGVQEVFLF